MNKKTTTAKKSKPSKKLDATNNARIDALTEEVSRINALNDELDAAFKQIKAILADVVTISGLIHNNAKDIDAVESDVDTAGRVALVALAVGIVAVILSAIAIIF